MNLSLVSIQKLAPIKDFKQIQLAKMTNSHFETLITPSKRYNFALSAFHPSNFYLDDVYLQHNIMLFDGDGSAYKVVDGEQKL